MRKRLVQWLKDFRIEISGYRSYDEAIITAGGVSLKEIDPRTMESKIVKGLFIVGELLDLEAIPAAIIFRLHFPRAGCRKLSDLKKPSCAFYNGFS